MKGIEFPTDENLLVGLDRADDAGVYRITPDLALIQTVDFFTPIVDDPYWFGQIAAANALSDVYAMGGNPKTAMNLVGFPLGRMDISVLRRILQGGLDKLKEAEVVLVGGHSVEDQELKYGLSVTGVIHPSRILTKNRIAEGDALILTKPLGTGIINTAIKAGLAGKDLIDRVTEIMAGLNKTAAQVMGHYQVQACTDITGFGLAGHMAEMLQGTGLSFSIKSGQLPILPEALDFAAMGLLPAGLYKNRDYRQCMVRADSGVDRLISDLIFDPQTSGGLLICCPGDKAEDLLAGLKKAGIQEAAIIGRVCREQGEKIMLE